MSASGLLDDGRAESRGIGTILRGAREAAGYSIDDIAARMRLNRDNIENMEAERFDRFPVAVFLRGYLTSYARLLELDPKPLIEAYDRKGFGPPRLHSQEAPQGKLRGSEFTVTVTTLLVVAVLIVLSVLWWRERWGENGEAALAGPALEQLDEPGPAGGGAEDEPGGPTGVLDAGGAPDIPSSPASTENDGGSPENDGGSPSFPEGSDLSAAPASEPDSGSGAEGGAVAPSEEEEGPPSGAGGDPGDAAATAANAPAPVSPAGSSTAGADGAAPAGAPALIVIRVREDCWIMIRDAEDRFVYRDLASAGTTLELSGAPPIRVVAGYAKGIDVEYNGEPFDLSSHIEQETGTARFRLGS